MQELSIAQFVSFDLSDATFVVFERAVHEVIVIGLSLEELGHELSELLDIRLHRLKTFTHNLISFCNLLTGGTDLLTELGDGLRIALDSPSVRLDELTQLVVG